MFRIAIAALVSSMLSLPAVAEPIKLASWNVANLAEAPDVELRGHARTAAEIANIAGILKGLDADIIALQEMGSIPSAKSILGSDYEVAFETSCLENAKKCEHDVGDIFTAIAYRKSLGNLKVVQVPELGIEHADSCGGAARRVRGAVGVEFENDGRSTIALSVHLKASCKDNDAEARPDQMDDCATLNKQVDILIDWIGKRNAEDKDVIVMGDFNRELLTTSDNVSKKLKAAFPALSLFPKERKCWANFRLPRSEIIAASDAKFPEIRTEGGTPIPYGPKSNAEIDFFLTVPAGTVKLTEDLQVAVGDDAVVTEKATGYIKNCEGKPSKFESGGVLVFSEVEPSDHCPITAELH